MIVVLSWLELLLFNQGIAQLLTITLPDNNSFPTYSRDYQDATAKELPQKL